MRNSRVLCGALLCLPAVAFTQVPAADPASQSPAVLYRSVFADTPKGVETDTVAWRAANDAVGQFQRGHIDILKWEAAQAKVRAANGAATPAAPDSPKGGSKP